MCAHDHKGESETIPSNIMLKLLLWQIFFLTKFHMKLPYKMGKSKKEIGTAHCVHMITKELIGE